MMTTIASAATKSVVDPSGQGLFGKASSDNGEAGEFAQALTDLGSDAEDGSSGKGSATGLAADIQADTAPVATRFNYVTALTQFAVSVNPDGQATPQADETRFVSGPGQPSAETTQAVQGQTRQVDPNALLQAAAAKQSPAPADGEQPPLPTIGKDQQTLQPIASKPVLSSPQTQLASSAVGGGEDAATDADLLQLGSFLNGPRRISSSSGTGPKQDATASTGDEPGDADTLDSGTIPTEAADTLSTALSTEALLHLTYNSPIEPGSDMRSVAPLMGTGVAAVPDRLDEDALQTMPPADDADSSLDFLSPAAQGSDVREPASFRFQKAGDAAVAVSLSIAKSEDGGSELQESLPGTPKPETITVLDSRRYLGFGMGANASAVLSAASSDPHWAAAMHPASALSNAVSASGTGNVVNTLKLQLNPEHLGAVTANMRLVGEELSIHLTVHSSAAYRELNDDVKPMLDSLRAQGFNVDQVTISISPSADANKPSGDQPQGNNGQPQQQMTRDGETARQQPQQQERTPNRSGRGDMEKRNEIAVEAGIGRGDSSGNIYL